jgi:MFS family permease
LSIGSVFTSPKVWLLCAIFFGIEMGSYAVGFWQPTIIRQSGVKDAFTIGLLTTIPYATALVTLVLTGRHSDRTRERRWHTIFPSLAAAAGFLLCTRGSNTALAMFGLVLAAAGVITAVAMFWALPTSLLGGNAAAAGIAFVNCTGNLGGFFSPTIIGFLKTYTGTLNSGLYLIAGCMVASSILIFTLAPAPIVSLRPQEEPI